MRVAFIDHYDSFSFNVIDWLAGMDQSVAVDYVACDDEAGIRRLQENYCPLVLSPGPGRPEDAAETLALVNALMGRVPILGICLGHQILALAAGGRVLRGVAPHHGSTRALFIRDNRGLLEGVPQGTKVATYNSLVVDHFGLADGWSIDATCDLGEVQAISRRIPGQAPAFGLQFHPESFLSEGAAVIRRNWLAIVAQHSEIAPFDMPS